MITERVAAPGRRKKSLAVPLPRRWLGVEVGGAVEAGGGGEGVEPPATSERCSPKLFPRSKLALSLRRRVAPEGTALIGRLKSDFDGGNEGAPRRGDEVGSSMLPEPSTLSLCDPEGSVKSKPIIPFKLLLWLPLLSLGTVERTLDTASARAFLSAMGL